MKWLTKILRFLVTALAMLAIQFFIINFLPYPFNQVNFIFAVLLATVSAGEGWGIFLLALAVLYFSELFSGLPFGFGIAAALLSLFFIQWLQFNIFTNRSLYIVLLSALIGLSLHRFLILFFLTINNYFADLDTKYFTAVGTEVLWEIALSSLLLFTFYILRYKVFKNRLNSLRQPFKFYG